jgi:hypothetical protein
MGSGMCCVVVWPSPRNSLRYTCRIRLDPLPLQHAPNGRISAPLSKSSRVGPVPSLSIVRAQRASLQIPRYSGQIRGWRLCLRNLSFGVQSCMPPCPSGTY